MQPYQETFQSKGQAFTIRTPRVEDAAALIAYMEVIDQETTFLTREPGEFAQNVTLEKEQAFLRSCLEDEGQLFLIVEDGDGSIVATCNCSSMARRRSPIARSPARRQSSSVSEGRFGRTTATGRSWASRSNRPIGARAWAAG
mgnify:CR=1 FL=1